jgi:predicted small lipoprotein YifL
MRTTLMTLSLVAAVVALSACGEKPQEMGGTRSDAAPYAGVGKSQYQQPGWKVGDKASWEQQLKSRAQYGMNEYTRATQ